MWFLVEGLEIDAVRAPANPDSVIKKLLSRIIKVDEKYLKQCLIKSKSIDSRRSKPYIVYSVFVESEIDIAVGKAGLKISSVDIETVNKKYKPELNISQNVSNDSPVIIVGTGPAGIFAALGLAEAGFKVIVLDRGKKVDERNSDWQKFLQTRELDEESNLLIGEGGAGTFSDGKLFTRTKDANSDFILKTFVDHGASEDTIYLKRPHIGSDVLPKVAESMRRKIESCGGDFLFGTEVKSLLIENGTAVGVLTAGNEKIYGSAVLVAHGLGGRALTMEMIRQRVPYELKGFQIGCRIEHPQNLIDRQQYHLKQRPLSLGSAEYNFVSQGDERMNIKGVSTFCMCPGGELVMASAWRNSLTSNGMSLHARGGKFANSCLIMSIDGKNFPDAACAYGFLQSYERAAFEAGGGDYTLPAQSAAGFLNGREELIYRESSSQTGVRAARLDLIFSEDLRNSLRRALLNFQKKCPFFIDCGQFAGIESCVSSPIRFVRNAETLESGIKNLYICGEGAGYAGGIMSGAIDGLRAAAKIAGKC